MSVGPPTAPKGGSPPKRGGRMKRYAGNIQAGAHAARAAKNAFWNYGAGAQERAAAQGKSPTQQTGAAIRAGAKNAAGMFKHSYNENKPETGKQPKIPGLKKAQKKIPGNDLRSQEQQEGIPSNDLRKNLSDGKKIADKLKGLTNANNPQGQLGALNKLRQMGNKNKTPTKDLRAQAKQQVKKMAKEAVKKGIRQAGRALAAETFGLSVVAAELLIHWRETLIIGISLFLLLFALFDSSSFDTPPQSTPGTPTTTDSCTPAQFSGDAFGQTTVCTITINYAGSAQDISISDSIMPGTKFVSATSNGLPDASQTLVTWDAKQDGLALNPVNITVSVVLQVTTHQKNLKIYNPYAITPTGLSGASNNGSTTIPGNLPPSTDNCSGIYSYYMGITPGHQNYGDPTCTLIKKDPNGTAIINKDAILSELKTLKPSEAMGWFICVVPNESGYNANAYLGASTSGYGAYGLVQMNPTGKGNGQFDNGQVVWPLQLSNGINYNDKNIGHTFSYWPKSYDSCLNNYGVTVN